LPRQPLRALWRWSIKRPPAVRATRTMFSTRWPVRSLEPQHALTSTLSACSSDLGKAVGASCVFRDVVTGDNAVPCYNGYYNCTITTASDQYGVTSGYNAPAALIGDGPRLDQRIKPSQRLDAGSTAYTFDDHADVTPTSGNYGTTLSYAITVAPTSGKGTPTGSVILLADNASIASADLSSSSASARLTPSAPASIQSRALCQRRHLRQQYLGQCRGQRRASRQQHQAVA